MVRNFQRVIGREARAQILEQEDRLPTAIVACVAADRTPSASFTTSSAIKMSADRRRGGGRGTRSAITRHASRRLMAAYPECCKGHSAMCCKTTRPDRHNPLRERGLDYASVGPEHAMLHDLGRAEYTSASMRKLWLQPRRWRGQRESCPRSKARTPSPKP